MKRKAKRYILFLICHASSVIDDIYATSKVLLYSRVLKQFLCRALVIFLMQCVFTLLTKLYEHVKLRLHQNRLRNSKVLQEVEIAFATLISFLRTSVVSQASTYEHSD